MIKKYDGGGFKWFLLTLLMIILTGCQTNTNHLAAPSEISPPLMTNLIEEPTSPPSDNSHITTAVSPTAFAEQITPEKSDSAISSSDIPPTETTPLLNVKANEEIHTETTSSIHLNDGLLTTPQTGGSSSVDDASKYNSASDDQSQFSAEWTNLSQGIVTGRYYDEMAADPASFFDDWHAMGIEWIRIEFEEFWSLSSEMNYQSPEVLKNRDKYSIIIREAHKRDIRVLGVVGFNAMKRNSDFPNTEKSREDYRDAVHWHLQNYDIDAVELWNEPLYYGFSPPAKLARYSELMVKVYETLKPGYPDVLFVAPVTSNAEKGEWLGYRGNNGQIFKPEESIFNCKTMLEYRDAHKGKLPLDVISWHPYGDGGDPKENSDGTFYYGKTFAEYFAEIFNYQDVKNRPIVGNYPIWFTEYGWDSRMKGEANQRLYYENMIAEIRKIPQIQVAMLYTYRDDENVAGSENKNYGIRKNQMNYLKPKKVYYSFFSNNSGVGLRTNGKTVDTIIVKYQELGSKKVIGTPVQEGKSNLKYVQELGNDGWVQYFDTGLSGLCSIWQKEGVEKAYLVKGKAFLAYQDPVMRELYGWPVSDEYVDKEDLFRQDFESGSMVWKKNSAINFEKISPTIKSSDDILPGIMKVKDKAQVILPIVEKYQILGEPSIGFPVSNVAKWNSKAYIQEFSGGTFGMCRIISEFDSDDAYVLKQDVFEFYSENSTRDRLGWPVSEEYVSNGVVYQDFQLARIEKTDGKIIFSSDIGWLTGTPEIRLPSILDAYDRAGGIEVAGLADGKVHAWDNGVLIQNLKEGLYGNRMALMQKGKNAVSAYILQDRFFDFYVNVGAGIGKNSGPTGYGCILSDPYQKDGITLQDCEYGRMILANNEVSWILNESN